MIQGFSGLNENYLKLLFFFKSASSEFFLYLFTVHWGFIEGSLRVH